MIRIVFLIDRLACGGAEQALFDLVRLMDKNTFDITVFVVHEGDWDEKFRQAGIRVVHSGSGLRPSRNPLVRLAKTDDRIRVIHKENGGAATARNAGLDAAGGDYIAFVDADDLLHRQYLEYLHRLLTDHGAEIAMCHYDFFEDEAAVFSGPPPEEVILLHGPELLATFHQHCRKVSLISLCMKLYKKEIFDGLRIPEGFIEEDSMSLPLILERARTIVRSEARLYHWRVTPGSVTRSGFTAKSFAYIEVSRFQAEFFAARGSGEADHFQREFLQRVLKYYYKTRDEAPALMEALKPYLKQYRRLLPRYIRARGLCVREKAAYALFPLCPRAARGLYETVYGQEDTP